MDITSKFAIQARIDNEPIAEAICLSLRYFWTIDSTGTSYFFFISYMLIKRDKHEINRGRAGERGGEGERERERERKNGSCCAGLTNG